MVRTNVCVHTCVFMCEKETLEDITLNRPSVEREK